MRKDEDFSKARILVFYLPDNTGQVYIQGTVQKTNSPVIASLGTKRMNYLNRIALDGSKREPRLDALANIFSVFDYKYDEIQYPCGSRQELYREVERMKDFPLRFIIVESLWTDVINPFSYRTTKARRVSAAAIVMSSIVNLMIIHNIHVIFAGENAKYITKRLLLKTYEYYQDGKIKHNEQKRSEGEIISDKKKHA